MCSLYHSRVVAFLHMLFMCLQPRSSRPSVEYGRGALPGCVLRCSGAFVVLRCVSLVYHSYIVLFAGSVGLQRVVSYGPVVSCGWGSCLTGKHKCSHSGGFWLLCEEAISCADRKKAGTTFEARQSGKCVLQATMASPTHIVVLNQVFYML